MFVSKQGIIKEDDIFNVGVSIHKIRRMSKTYTISDKDGPFLVRYWEGLKTGKNETSFFSDNQLSIENTKVDGNFAVKKIKEKQLYENTYPLKTMEYVIGLEDTLILLILECPADFFDEYKPVFE